MKEINREFAMKMLEKKLGKPAKQILEEAMEESEEWPMGRYEFENSLGGHEDLAKAVIAYFGEKRPAVITRDDIEEIFRRRTGVKVVQLTDLEIESRREGINLVYDIYEDL